MLFYGSVYILKDSSCLLYKTSGFYTFVQILSDQMATQRSISFQTLGCKLNFSETSSIKSMFEEQGYAVLNEREPVDIFVLNTCSVTEFADKKCRKEIRRVKGQNPDTKIVVIGCYAQLKPQEIADIPGVNLVLGAAEKFRILDFIPDLFENEVENTYFAQEISQTDTFYHAHSEKDRTRAFLKVQDGCDYKCTFCTIPLARGKSRSDTVENVVQKAKDLVSIGTKEIVLTGVNIGDFGHGHSLSTKDKRNRKESFLDLIKALDEEVDIDRIRISSIEPNLLTDEIIEFVAQSKRFMPHFHIPLQSGSDEVLKIMQRRYDSSLYRSRVEKIKSLMPDACIGIDIIVGFPSETDELFEKCYEFVDSLDASYFHIFTYSQRSDTPAGEQKIQVPMNIRRERNQKLQRLSELKKRRFYKAFLGSERKVLFEKSKTKGKVSGFTDNYIKIEADHANYEVNEIKMAKLNEFGDQLIRIN